MEANIVDVIKRDDGFTIVVKNTFSDFTVYFNYPKRMAQYIMRQPKGYFSDLNEYAVIFKPKKV